MRQKASPHHGVVALAVEQVGAGRHVRRVPRVVDVLGKRDFLDCFKRNFFFWFNSVFLPPCRWGSLPGMPPGRSGGGGWWGRTARRWRSARTSPGRPPCAGEVILPQSSPLECNNSKTSITPVMSVQDSLCSCGCLALLWWCDVCREFPHQHRATGLWLICV